MRTEADRIFTVSSRRNSCPCSLLASKLPDPVGVVPVIREQHRLWKQGAEENRAQPVVVGLTGREGEMDLQAIGVHDHMDLACQAIPRATYILMIVARETGTVLV